MQTHTQGLGQVCRGIAVLGLLKQGHTVFTALSLICGDINQFHLPHRVWSLWNSQLRMGIFQTHEEKDKEKTLMKRKIHLSPMSCQGAPDQEKNLPVTRVAHTNGPNRENRLILQPLIIPATVPSKAINHLPSLSAQEPGAKQRSRATAGALTIFSITAILTLIPNVDIISRIYPDNEQNISIYLWKSWK